MHLRKDLVLLLFAVGFWFFLWSVTAITFKSANIRAAGAISFVIAASLPLAAIDKLEMLVLLYKSVGIIIKFLRGCVFAMGIIGFFTGKKSRNLALIPLVFLALPPQQALLMIFLAKSLIEIQGVKKLAIDGGFERFLSAKAPIRRLFLVGFVLLLWIPNLYPDQQVVEFITWEKLVNEILPNLKLAVYHISWGGGIVTGCVWGIKKQ